MSVTTETQTAPDGTRPHRGRRIALWVTVGALVLLAVLAVVAELVLRGVVDRVVAQQVEQALPEGTTGKVQAHASGVIIPQLLAGTLDRVEISSKRITVDGIPLAADVTARDVPVDGHGAVHDVDGTVTLASGSVKDLSKYSALFGNVSLEDGGVELAGKTSVLGYDIAYAAQGTVAAESDGQGITITPTSVKIENNALGLKLDDLPGVLDNPVSVCTARFLPEATRIRSLDVTRSHASVRITASALPLSEDGLRTTGTC
jgi:hypothetical protein